MTEAKIRTMPRSSRSEDDQVRRPTRQYGTVGYLQELLNKGERRKFEKTLRELLGIAPSERYFHAIKHRNGKKVFRSAYPPEAKIDLYRYSPPNIWGDPGYSILRWKVRCDADTASANGFFSHGGEEVLYTEDPGLIYGFFDPQSPNNDRHIPVKPRKLLRVRPQFPHHNFKDSEMAEYSADDKGPEGWMILRSISGSANTDAYPVHDDPPDGIELDDPDPASGNDPRQEAHGFLKRDDLGNPSFYAMHRWGIAEQIKRQRQKNGLTINQLAIVANLNASFLSRLENGTANISLSNFFRLAEILGIDLLRLDQLHRPAEEHPIYERPAEEHPLYENCCPASEPHWLHICRHELRVNRPYDPIADLASGERKFTPLPGEAWSWIVTKGRAEFEMTLSNSPDGPMVESLAADEVIHLAHAPQLGERISFRATQAATLIEVRVSARCPFRPTGLTQD